MTLLEKERLLELLDNPPHFAISKWEVREWVNKIRQLVREMRDDS